MLNHRDQIATFEMNRMPPDFPVELFFHSRWQAGKDLKIEDASSRMVRILDPLPVIKELMNRSISETVVIKIKDKLLPQNNLTIEIGKGTARLSEAPNDLEITISDLTPPPDRKAFTHKTLETWKASYGHGRTFLGGSPKFLKR